MTITAMHHVSVVVENLEAAKGFFVALGMELEGETPVEGAWVDRVNALDGVRVDIAMMRTPDGHGRVELWSEDGTLLATASQSCIVRPRTLPPS